MLQVTGEIVVWGGANGGSTGDAHGRFTGRPVKPAPGQFNVGDVLRTACKKHHACHANGQQCKGRPHEKCVEAGGGRYECRCHAGYTNHHIQILSVDHSSGKVGQYFNFNGSTLALRPRATMYLKVSNPRTNAKGEVVVWGVDGNGRSRPGDAHGRFTGNPIRPAPGQWQEGDVAVTECMTSIKQSCNKAGVTMDSLGQCRPHKGLVTAKQCHTKSNPNGNCQPKVASKAACRQLLSDILSHENGNPGEASAAEYSGDSRQICWVVTGAKPRPNGKGPYHCFHEFDCSDPSSECQESSGEVTCECKAGYKSAIIEVTSIDHKSGLTGQYFNFNRATLGKGVLKKGGTLQMVVTVTPNGGGDEVCVPYM